MIVFFTARVAPVFASQPPNERLYEVVTPEGERVASTMDEMTCSLLAARLNEALNAWRSQDPSDRVIS